MLRVVYFMQLCIYVRIITYNEFNFSLLCLQDYQAMLPIFLLREIKILLLKNVAKYFYFYFLNKRNVPFKCDTTTRDKLNQRSAADDGD